MESTGRYQKDQVNLEGVVGTEGGRRPTGVPTTPLWRVRWLGWPKWKCLRRMKLRLSM
jgi:hypothetical protein